MPQILILADDLSGAADCGIACVEAGLTTIVTLGPSAEEVIADAIAIDADTRCLDAGSAAEKMQQLVQVHGHDPALLLFKKIDSTLRGNLGSELAAVLKARRVTVPRAIAIMAPAFPAHGRTTEEGVHYVHGTPLHETAIWKRERILGEAYIPHLLESSGLKCAHLNLALVRGSQAEFDRAVCEAGETIDVIVCDAVTDDDLKAIAEAAICLQERAVWVGSAGLAHQLSKVRGLAKRATRVPAPLLRAPGPILFVMGSASQTTRQQVDILISSTNIHCVKVPPETLLEGTVGELWQTFTTQLKQAVKRNEDTILVCGSEPVVDPGDRPRLSLALGEMVASVRGDVGALVLSGGETARKVLDRWGVRSMTLYGELETGVVISSTVVNGVHPTTVITKAGDFGEIEALLHCWRWLNQ